MGKSPILKLLDTLDYIPTNAEPPENGMPYVTHEGVLNIGEASIVVVVLNTGQRIIPEEEINKLFGIL